MSVLLKDLGNGIKSVIINDPKTYNSLSFKTLGSLIKIFKKLNNDPEWFCLQNIITRVS